MNRTKLMTILALILLLAGLNRPSSGFAQSGITLSIQPGFGGYCRYNQWLPVRVLLENQGADVEGRIEISQPRSGNIDNQIIYPISLPGVSRKEVILYVYAESFLTSVRVRLTSDGESLAQDQQVVDCLSAADLMAGVVAENSGAFSVLSELDPPSGRAVVANMELRGLPDRVSGLDALNLMVISGVDTTSLNPDQQAALETWVANGGQLLITGGPTWQKTAAGLGNLLPVELGGTQTLDNLQSLQDYVAEGDALRGSTIIVEAQPKPGAQILASQEGLPVLVEQSHGLGRVFYLAVDPALDPLREWSHLETFYRQVFADEVQTPSWSQGFQDWFSAGTALSVVSDQVLPSALLVFAFLFVYVAAVGPGNYLLVKVLKRRELAWVTIPGIVLLCSMGAFVIGMVTRGGQASIARIALVQVWPDSQMARVDALVGVISPSRATYNLEIGAPFLVRSFPSDFSMGTVSGRTFIQTGTGAIQVPDLRLDVSGMEKFSVEGLAPAEHLESDFTLELKQGNMLELNGSITNTTGQTLRDVVLLAPGQAQRLQDLRPGDKIQVGLTYSSSAREPQVGGDPGFPVGPGFVGGPFFGNPLVSDLLGTADINSDPELYRRFHFLGGLTNTGTQRNELGGGIYLAGWTDSAPFEATLDRSSRYDDLSLYLFAIHPELITEPGVLSIPPEFFTWEVVQSNSMGIFSPYNGYMDFGEHVVRYSLAQPIEYSRIESLTLHMESFSSSGRIPLELSLWSYQSGTWRDLPAVDWGNIMIENPDDFVSPHGEIRLRMFNSSNGTTVPLERADFTLVVER